jgi:hypothetical protein
MSWVLTNLRGLQAAGDSVLRNLIQWKLKNITGSKSQFGVQFSKNCVIIRTQPNCCGCRIRAKWMYATWTNVWVRNNVTINKQDGQCTYSVTLKRLCITIVAVDKLQVLNILCVQHTSVFPSLACLALPYFSTLPRKRRFFGGTKFIEHTVYSRI